jgi:nucleotide-binding universal stress UspA family protein
MAGMTDGIIAGYDGSPGSDDALRWAAREAKARETALTVCVAWAPEYLALLDDPAVYQLARQRGEEILARGVRFADSALDSGDVRAALAEGPPALVLCERSSAADMVVVGSRGRGGLAGPPLGSVSWHVAGYGQGKIVVVRGQWRPVNQPPGPVVVGTDGSPASQAAITFAFEEATLRDVPLVAVCALADAPGALGGARQREEDFSHAMTIQEKEHPEVTVLRQVAVGSPRSALLTAAAEAQMLVVGSRGLGGLEDMSLGSVVQAMLHHSPCPVAVVHPLVR